MKGADPLGAVERMAFVEEVSSVVRHAARNKLAAARNAATYIRRRLSQTDAWRNEPRIQTFHELMEQELDGVGELLEGGGQDLLGHFFTRCVERVDAAACVREAVECSRVTDSAREAIRVDARSADVTVDPRELALAVRCLIENAVEATDGGDGVAVVGASVDGRYSIDVSDAGPGIAEALREQACSPFFSTKPGHAGLGLNMARRVARRCGGELTLGTSGLGGLQAVLRLPPGTEGGA